MVRDEFETLLKELIKVERDDESFLACGWDRKEERAIKIRLQRARASMDEFVKKTWPK